MSNAKADRFQRVASKRVQRLLDGLFLTVMARGLKSEIGRGEDKIKNQIDMKKLICFIIILVGIKSFAQNHVLNELSFKDCNNPQIFKKIKNNTEIEKYITSKGAVLKKGDTLFIGSPSGSQTTTSINQMSPWVESNTERHFSTIILGRPAGFQNTMFALGGHKSVKANMDMEGEPVVISKMKAYHKGSFRSKKRALGLIILLSNPDGGGFGTVKYLSTLDYEKSVLAGEIRPLHEPMTRQQAIKKLKESKDLLDLGLLKQAEYDKMKEKLTPIINK